jgi:hypothetical protein
VIALAAAMLLQSPPATQDWLMYGTPNVSCREWLTDRHDYERRLVATSWLAGFLSGVNLSAGGRLTGLDALALANQIDIQCAALPDQRVADLLVNFISEAPLYEAAAGLEGTFIPPEDEPPAEPTPTPPPR